MNGAFPFSSAWKPVDEYSSYIPTAIVTAIFGWTEESVLKL
jgi:hypothetical protein